MDSISDGVARELTSKSGHETASRIIWALFFGERFLSNTKYYSDLAAHSNFAGVKNET